MTVRFEGIANLERIYAELGVKAQAVIPAALFQEAELVMKASRPLAPVYTGDRKDIVAGALRGSGHVALPQRTGRGWSIRFGYGGAAMAYAGVQHDHTEYQHTVGQAEYLKQPFEAAAPALEAALIARLKGIM